MNIKFLLLQYHNEYEYQDETQRSAMLKSEHLDASRVRPGTQTPTTMLVLHACWRGGGGGGNRTQIIFLLKKDSSVDQI